MKFFQSLSDSEMEIMRYVWDSGEAVTTSILLEAFAHKGWKVQTVSTFLTRLADKGALRVEKRGKANVYFPAPVGMMARASRPDKRASITASCPPRKAS